jgi:hypothetical protein
MFKRKQKELLASDASDGIEPWLMLEEDDIEAQTAWLRERRVERNLIAFARRLDKDALACFDKGPEGTSKTVLVLEDFDAPGGATERRYGGFGEWFDAALADQAEPL